MPTLAQLVFYPVKSCAGIALQEAVLTASGLVSGRVHDREWMVVDADGIFISQRTCARMAVITPHVSADALELRAPGMPPLRIPLDLPHATEARMMRVRVWDDTVDAMDCDEATADWFSAVLGAPCRLVRSTPEMRRLAGMKWTGGREAPTRFADAFPTLVISQASLDDLNGKLLAHGREALPMNRFRPNIVIDDMAAFEEDYAAVIRIGEAVLKPVKPCVRCNIPSIDQANAAIGPDPLDILRNYRVDPKMDGGITFGMNAIVLKGDNILLRVGQQTEIELDFQDLSSTEG